MKKNTLMYIGIGAAILFLFKDKLFAKKDSEEKTDDDIADKLDDKEKEKTDVVLDATKGDASVPELITKGKEIAAAIKDAKVVVKTPTGMPNIAIRSGKKKKKKKSVVDCSKIKSKKRQQKCYQKYPLQNPANKQIKEKAVSIFSKPLINA